MKNPIIASVSVLLLCLNFQYLLAQSEDGDPKQLKAVTPPSPNAAALVKFAEWPVSLHTATPGIEIPVAEIAERSVKVPVTLSYHASGIKVGEIASSVGLGWALDAGGVITRSRQGLADEYPQLGFFEFRKRYSDKDNMNSDLKPGYTNAETITQLADQLQDGEHDIYNISALGQNYKLMFMGDGTIKTIPYSKVKVQPDWINHEWTVTLEDGTIMKFGGSGNYEVTTESSEAPPYISSWWLTSLTGVTGEVISFAYTGSALQQTGNYFQKEKRANSGGTVTRVPGCACTNSNQSQGSGYGGSSADIGVSIRLLTTIDAPNARIDLELNDPGNEERLDAEGGRFYKSVSVFSKTKNAVVQKFIFLTGYSDARTGTVFSDTEKSYHRKRLKLNALYKLDLATNVPVEKWTFDYNPEKLPSRQSMAQDHWGYYNGALTNKSMLPFFEAYPAPKYKSGNREPNANYIQAEMLTKITYPTGGYSEFKFTPNTVSSSEPRDVYTSDHAGVDHIFKNAYEPLSGTVPVHITHWQAVNVLVEMVKTGLTDLMNLNINVSIYNQWNELVRHYGVNDNTPSVTEQIYLEAGDYEIRYNITGVDAYELDLDNNIILNAGFSHRVKSTVTGTYDKMVGGLHIDQITDYDLTMTEPMTRKFIFEKKKIQIPFILENEYLTTTYEELPIENTGGCTYVVDSGCFQEWEYRSSNLKTSMTSAPFTYGKVTTLYGPNGENGKSISYFTNTDDYGTGNANTFPFPPIVSNEWQRGQLIMKTDYDVSGNPISRTRNTFAPAIEFGRIINKKSGRNKILHIINTQDDPLNANTVTTTVYSTVTGLMRMLTSTEVRYNGPNDSLYTTTTYEYDNPNSLLPTSSHFENSKGETITKWTRTALDKAAIAAESVLSTDASNTIDVMVARNMITQPIQAVTTNGSQLLDVQTTNFKVVSALVLPADVVIKTGNNPEESRVSFNAYDSKGNLLEQQKTDDVVKSYVYDYNQQYVIAEATNANVNAIAYTSFESDGTGNWNISTQAFDARSWTGNNSYLLTNHTVSKPSLPSDIYTVSLWAIGSTSIVINSQTVPAFETRNGWSHYVYTTPSATTGVTITGNGTIDELRLHPGKSQMTTYTYDPMVGVTSQTDQSNRTIYYEYDSHNRLMIIRDDNGNILKHYEYNYQAR